MTDPSNQDREISVTTNNISVDVWSSVLTIRALPINDGIVVGCVVTDQNLDFAFKGVTLTVEGKLAQDFITLICLMTGITPVENLQFTFNVTTLSGWLIWSHPLFSSENTPISYHIYIENQHGQLLYNHIIEDTSYELYNLTVCDIYIATVKVIDNGQHYSSLNVTIQEEFSGGMLLLYYYNNIA